MKSHILLISVNPKFAIKIIQQLKTVELRRLRPSIAKGDKVVIYASSPEKSIRAIAIVHDVKSAPPDILWGMFKDKIGINHDEFETYFEKKSIGYAIEFENITPFNSPIQLSVLKSSWPNFHPPQCYKYLTNEEYTYLFDKLIENTSPKEQLYNFIPQYQLSSQFL